MGVGASRWSGAAKRICFPCASFDSTKQAPAHYSPRIISSLNVSNGPEYAEEKPEEAAPVGLTTNKSLCAICLESLSCDGDFERGIFTAQCSHAFHLVCIASNVRHGNVTCPICRDYWSELPQELIAFSRPLPPCHQADPILRILDDSITTSRVNRRSSLRSIRYDDDDPVEPAGDTVGSPPRLHIAALPNPTPRCIDQSSTLQYYCDRLEDPPEDFMSPKCSNIISPSERKPVCLAVRLSQQQATDLVLVVSPNGPHLRLLKQSIALVVFSLRPVDRLAIVTCSTTATRAFSLRRMTPAGKRIALHIIDRLFYLGEGDSLEGLRKGLKVLEDRMHLNPHSCILHILDIPTRAAACIGGELQLPVPIHRFCVGYGAGESNGLVMHEFEDFLVRLLGGIIRETELRIGKESCLVKLGQLRVREERRIQLGLITEDSDSICITYSYIEGAGAEERLRIGDVTVKLRDKGEGTGGGCGDGCRDFGSSTGDRRSSVERWEYLDPFMARRWAKHLHGCKA